MSSSTDFTPMEWAKILGIVLVIAAVVIFAGKQVVGYFQGPDATIEGEVDTFQAFDEANLEVRVEITNTGDEPAWPECRVLAYDASLLVGSDTVWWEQDLAPGDSFSYIVTIRIEDLGAERVQRVELEDCGVH